MSDINGWNCMFNWTSATHTLAVTKQVYDTVKQLLEIISWVLHVKLLFIQQQVKALMIPLMGPFIQLSAEHKAHKDLIFYSIGCKQMWKFWKCFAVVYTLPISCTSSMERHTNSLCHMETIVTSMNVAVLFRSCTVPWFSSGNTSFWLLCAACSLEGDLCSWFLQSVGTDWFLHVLICFTCRP